MLRERLDGMDAAGLKQAFRVFRDLSVEFDFETVIAAMTEAVQRDTLDGYSASAIALRILSVGLDIAPEAGPDLSSYDAELISTGRLS
jgi:hypothetical protein